jgi:hypothetical protein
MNARFDVRSALRKRAHVWVPAWLADRARKRLTGALGRAAHVVFAVCDHFEPLHGQAPHEIGIARVQAWRDRYPHLAARFRDSVGRPPRHTFFYPGEQYDPALLEPLGELCAMGLGEVEVHLHHDGDTRDSLRSYLEATLANLDDHGLVAHIRNRPSWAFIHGNWALANARRDGRWCGVDDELALLRALGCHSDFTFPSAPDECQPRIVNAIYWPSDDTQRRGYDRAERARVGDGPRNRVLLLQGPLAIARRGRRGPRMRIEAAALSASDPPTAARVRTWIDQAVSVDGRPEWVFVKVHTHGAPERNADAVLGPSAVSMHAELARWASRPGRSLTYVTAREMFNVARAAIDGRLGVPADFLDYVVPPPPRARGAAESSTRSADRVRVARR